MRFTGWLLVILIVLIMILLFSCQSASAQTKDTVGIFYGYNNQAHRELIRLRMEVDSLNELANRNHARLNAMDAKDKNLDRKNNLFAGVGVTLGILVNIWQSKQ